jgi:hypothetical protein
MAYWAGLRSWNNFNCWIVVVAIKIQIALPYNLHPTAHPFPVANILIAQTNIIILQDINYAITGRM